MGAEALVAKGVEEDGFLFRQSINFADNDAELVCGVDAETNGVGRSAKNFERKVVCLRVRDAVFADVFYGAILCSNGVFVFQASKANKTTWYFPDVCEFLYCVKGAHSFLGKGENNVGSVAKCGRQEFCDAKIFC